MRNACFVVATFLIVNGCEDAGTKPETFATPCAGDVALTVSPGLEPVFTWTPSCGMSFIYVATVPAQGEIERSVWSFGVPEQQPVGPGIRYGEAPARGEVGLHQPLVAGVTYRARVWQTVGGDVVVAGGTQVFTP